MERCCADQGLPFRKPSSFPRGSLLAARIAAAHRDAPWVGDFVRAVYHANFVEDRDISEDSVIAAVVDEISQESGPIIATATMPNGKFALRAATDEALERGLFGAPSFLVGGALFWGNDRLEQALRYARGV